MHGPEMEEYALLRTAYDRAMKVELGAASARPERKAEQKAEQNTEVPSAVEASFAKQLFHFMQRTSTADPGKKRTAESDREEPPRGKRPKLQQEIARSHSGTNHAAPPSHQRSGQLNERTSQLSHLNEILRSEAAVRASSQRGSQVMLHQLENAVATDIFHGRRPTWNSAHSTPLIEKFVSRGEVSVDGLNSMSYPPLPAPPSSGAGSYARAAGDGVGRSIRLGPSCSLGSNPNQQVTEEQGAGVDSIGMERIRAEPSLTKDELRLLLIRGAESIVRDAALSLERGGRCPHPSEASAAMKYLMLDVEIAKKQRQLMTISERMMMMEKCIHRVDGDNRRIVALPTTLPGSGRVGNGSHTIAGAGIHNAVVDPATSSAAAMASAVENTIDSEARQVKGEAEEFINMFLAADRNGLCAIKSFLRG